MSDCQKAQAVEQQNEFRNDMEKEYALYLEERKCERKIKNWLYEPLKLNLVEEGKRCTWTPDFIVWNGMNEIELHELKGLEREDDIIKFKAAASKFRFWRFKMIKGRKVHGEYKWDTVREL